MKRMLVLLAMIMGVSNIYAQSEADMWELTKSDLKKEYKTIIIESMLFSEEEAAAFWPVFNVFIDEKNNLLDQDMKLLKDYADNYDSIDDAKIDDLVNRAMKIDTERLKLRKNYYKKLVKILPKRKAGKLYQIDNQISTLLDFQIISQIPILE